MKTAEEILQTELDKEGIVYVFDEHEDYIGDQDYAFSQALSAMHEYAEQFKPKWIPVAERLPEPDSAFYLVSCGVKNITLIMWYGLNDSGSHSWFYVDSIVKPYLLPHHWMPLPDAP